MKKLILGISFLSFFLITYISYSQWVPVNNGFPEFQLETNCLVEKDNKLFVGTSRYGVFSSSDYGFTWMEKNQGLDVETDSLLAIRNIEVQDENLWLRLTHYIDKGLIHGIAYELYMSNNNGASWIKKNSNLPTPDDFSIYSVNIKIFGDSIFSLDPENGVYLSTNEGNSWERVLAPMLAKDINIDKNHRIYLYTNEFRIIRSTNEGILWDTIRGQSIFNFMTLKGDTIFIGGWGEGVLRSVDYGDTWEEMNNGLTMPDVRSFLVKDNIIFIGTSALDGPEGGVYYSTNGGELWIQKSEGLTDLWVTDLATIGDYIFAATRTAGVFRAKISDLITDVKESDPISNNTIYPNPASDFINISNYVGWNYEIYDLLGNNIQSGFIDSDKILVSSLAAGFYTIRFTNMSKTEVKKFIKE